MKKILLVSLLIIGLISCKKVSELNNIGIVEKFSIVDGSLTAGVELAKTPVTISVAQEKGGENYIYINVHKGMHVTPIEFSANIIPNKEAVKILNIEKDSLNANISDISDYKFSFTSGEEVKSFYVIAESGQATEWKTKLIFDNLSKEAEIESFAIINLPTGTIATQYPTINSIENSISLYHIRGAFPLKVYPSITISKDAKLDYDGMGMTFSAQNVPLNIKVTSQSGFVKTWKTTFLRTESVKGGESKEQLSKMSINKYNFNPKYLDDDSKLIYSIDSLSGKIDFYISSNDLVARRNIDLNINPVIGGDVAGQQEILFTQGGQKKYIYMIDKASILYRKWEIVSNVLSNDVIIVSDVTFENYTSDNNIVVNKVANIDKNNKTIYFNINSSVDKFNVTLNGLKCITNSGATNTLPSTATFTTYDDVVNFTITSPNNNNTENWKIKLKGVKVNTEAELTDFDFASTNIDWSNIYVEKNKKKITIETNQTTDLDFIPNFTVSRGATVTSKDGKISNNNSSSATIDTQHIITVTAEDGIAKTDWTIEFMYAPQIAERDFDTIEDKGDATNFLTWKTANVKSPVKLIGTKILQRGDENRQAVECTTSEQDALLFGKMVAAAMAFKGQFKLEFSAEGMLFPRTMAKFGIPVVAPVTNKPIYFSSDIKYIKGAKMQQAINIGSSASPKFEIRDSEGHDKGYVFVEFLNYTQNGGDISKVPGAYSGNGRNGKGENAEGVTVISRAYVEVGGEANAYSNWVNNTVTNFVHNSAGLETTHIAVALTSSAEGDKYKGALGSKISVDNIVIHYYIPEEGAIIKKIKRQ